MRASRGEAHSSCHDHVAPTDFATSALQPVCRTSASPSADPSPDGPYAWSATTEQPRNGMVVAARADENVQLDAGSRYGPDMIEEDSTRRPRAAAIEIEDTLPAAAAAADASTGSPLNLGALRPEVDAVQLELIRERAERKLFGAAEPARLGRFVLLGERAAGGMGVVVRAYDPQLDRRVALKLLHPDASRSTVRRERLLAEARALARLDHPNVVPIHDVVVIDDQVVIVMEWVEGETLASWERQQPRGWREVIAAYAGAGRGLAAAHALGLVHRDFKPANAIIGGDGRVRILDFGLARFESKQSESAPSERGAPAPEQPEAAGPAPQPTTVTAPTTPSPVEGLTVAGEVLGTLAYMAPEQLLGEVATAASDQFSFCVAVYRAIGGVEPYGGATIEERLARINAGKLAEVEAGRRVPTWLRALLARGLAATAAARHPSMTALLDELERERGWRRWRLPIAVALAISGALLVARLVRDEPAALASCDSGGPEIARTWDPAASDALAQTMGAVSSPFATAIRAPVLQRLDGYRDEWAAMHRAACLDHRDGAQSDTALDRRMTCLLRRREALAAAVTELRKVDAVSILRARELVANLPPVADCRDPHLLEQDSDPPAPAVRDKVDGLQAQLAQAVALEHLGKSQEALQLVREIRTAAAGIDYPALIADIELTEGRILLFEGENERAQGPLAKAEALSFEHGLLTRAVIAGARRIYVRSMRGDNLAGLVGEAAVLEKVSRSLRDGFARPLLLNNIGAMHLAMAQRRQANEAFTMAKQELATVAEPDLELSIIDFNAAMLIEDDAIRGQAMRNVWQRRRAQLGDEHLQTLEAQLATAKYLRDPMRAAEVTRDACARYRQVYPNILPLRVECGAYLALISRELGDTGGALAAYDEVSALARQGKGGEVPALLAAGAAAGLRGQDASARAAFAQVISLATGSEWWVRRQAAEAHLGIGLLWRSAPELQGPMDHLERAIATYAELSALNEESEYRLQLALARATLAALLRKQGHAEARVAELERLAGEFYRAAGASSYQLRLRALGG
jgi:eukaryotic-like serine/threonine-protein kinase